MGHDDLAAAILVGGQSRRMGANKALLRLEPDGPTVVESIVRKLGEVADEVFLVGAEPADFAFLGLPMIPDAIPGTGALGGIHAALRASRNPQVLIVGCDLPFLSVNLLRYMASLPCDYDVLVPMVGELQPLHAIYTRTCLPVVEQCLRSGQYQVKGWLAQADVRTIEQPVVRQYDPLLLSSFNMNTPEHLAFAKQVLADRVTVKSGGDNEPIS